MHRSIRLYCKQDNLQGSIGIYFFAYCPKFDEPAVLINYGSTKIGELCGDGYPDGFHIDFI